MSDDQLLEKPEGRAAGLFPSREKAEAAKAALIEHGHHESQINTAHGAAGASELDDSARWFADTDDHIEIYKTHLARGASAVAVPVSGDDQVDQVRRIFKTSGASMMTHFGGIVTESESF